MSDLLGTRVMAAVIVMACIIQPGLGAQAEFTVPKGATISLQLNDDLNTKTNNEGDPFSATVAAPVYLGDRIVIPKGSIVNGSISRIVRPGRFKGKAVLNLLFQTIRIPGHSELPIVASLARINGEGGVRSEGTVEGEGSAGKDAGRVLTPGVVGAGIGGLAGGGKGAAIGAGVGAAVGLATVFGTRGKDLEMHRGCDMDIALDRALVISSEESPHR
jgi:hypothetical protein